MSSKGYQSCQCLAKHSYATCATHHGAPAGQALEGAPLHCGHQACQAGSRPCTGVWVRASLPASFAPYRQIAGQVQLVEV